MADNYLEKKMEEYRRGTPRPVMRRSPSGVARNIAAMPCALSGAFFVCNGQLSPLLRACATALRDTSCRIGFCSIDHSYGNKTAQQLSFQFYPIAEFSDRSVENVIFKASESFGKIDAIIKENDSGVEISGAGSKSTITAADDCSEDVFLSVVPRFIVYLLLPQSRDLGISGKFIVDSSGHLSVIED